MSSVSPPLQAMRRRRVRRRSAASSRRPRRRGASGRAGQRARIRYPTPRTVSIHAAAVGAELRAQQVDVRLDRVRRQRRPVGPRLVQELVAREDLARAPEEAFQDRVLALAQVDRPPCHGHAAVGLVEDDRAGLQGDPAARRRAAAEGPQAGEELLVGERLHEVVVGARVQALDAGADRVAGGQHEDRDRRALRPQAAGDVEARAVREADVEDDGVELGLGRELQPLGGGRRAVDDVAILGQEAGEEADEARVVLDEEQVHGATPGRRAGGVTPGPRPGAPARRRSGSRSRSPRRRRRR